MQPYRKNGWAVLANSRSIPASSDAGIVTVAGDIADPATARNVIDTAVREFGRVDTLVNNAGVYVAKPFTDYTAEDYEFLVGVNLTGFVMTTQLAIAQMLRQGEGGTSSGGAIDALDVADPGVMRAWGALVGSALPSARP